MIHTVILHHYIPGPNGRRQRQLARLTGTLTSLTSQIQAYCPQIPSQTILGALQACPWEESTAISSDYRLTYSHHNPETMLLPTNRAYHLEDQPD